MYYTRIFPLPLSLFDSVASDTLIQIHVSWMLHN